MTFRDDGSEHTDVLIADESQAVLSRGVLETGAAWKATADTFLLRIKDTASVRSLQPLPSAPCPELRVISAVVTVTAGTRCLECLSVVQSAPHRMLAMRT